MQMELETPHVHLCIRNRILVGTYKRGQQINLEAAKAIVRTRKLFVEGASFPVLIISQGLVSMDGPARRYLSSEDATAGVLACAIVVNSVFSACLSNFFCTVYHTAMPVKIFPDVARAEKWLQQFAA